MDVNDNDFQQKVIERSKEIPVTVDFWAVWCMPCITLSPILEKLEKEYKGKFILVEVNVDEARGVAQRYGIMSIPTVKLFKNGEVIDEFIGAMPESVVKEWVEKNLK